MIGRHTEPHYVADGAGFLKSPAQSDDATWKSYTKTRQAMAEADDTVGGHKSKELPVTVPELFFSGNLANGDSSRDHYHDPPDWEQQPAEENAPLDSRAEQYPPF